MHRRLPQTLAQERQVPILKADGQIRHMLLQEQDILPKAISFAAVLAGNEETCFHHYILETRILESAWEAVGPVYLLPFSTHRLARFSFHRYLTVSKHGLDEVDFSLCNL